MMNKNKIFIISIVVGLVLLFISFKLFPIDELLKVLADVDLRYVLLYLIVSFMIFLLLTYRWYIVVKKYNLKVGFWSLVAYRYVGFAISFTTPGPRIGGEYFRASLMNNMHNKFSSNFSTVIIDKTIELLTYGILFIINIILLFIITDIEGYLRIVLIIILGLLLLAVTFSLKELLSGNDPISKLFKKLKLSRISLFKKRLPQLREYEKNLKSFYTYDKKTFWKAFLVSSIAWSSSLIEFSIILHMLGVKPSFMLVFLVYSAVGLAYLLPVPMALGVSETLQASIFSALKLPVASGVAIAMITRARDLLWASIGYVIYAFTKLK